jgi:hypothetical protein
LCSKEPNYQHRVLLISAGTIEGHFEAKNSRENTKAVIFLLENVPAHRALATQKKRAYLGFHYFDQQPDSPNLAPSYYHLFPGLKKQLKGRHFFPTLRSLLLRRSG